MNVLPFAHKVAPPEASRVYLDGHSSMPLFPPALDVMIQAFHQSGNPSSVHQEGQKARIVLEDARQAIALHIDADPDEIFFTSGGTEANNWALQGLAKRMSAVLVGATEHPCVLDSDCVTHVIPVDGHGCIAPDQLEGILKTLQPPFLVSTMLVNHETGVIQDVAALARRVHAYGGYLHTDAIQALGKIPLSFYQLGVDMMSFSSHKVGGPAGIGALVVKKGVPLQPMLCGGGQERGLRPGTVPVPLVAGFAQALDYLQDTQFVDLADIFQQQCPQAVVVGEGAPRVSTALCVRMPGVSQEVQLMAFDLDGFAVSAGAACASGKTEASPVLTAMGLAPEEAGQAIRLSATWRTKASDIMDFAQCWNTLYQKKGSR